MYRAPFPVVAVEQAVNPQFLRVTGAPLLMETPGFAVLLSCHAQPPPAPDDATACTPTLKAPEQPPPGSRGHTAPMRGSARDWVMMTWTAEALAASAAVAGGLAGVGLKVTTTPLEPLTKPLAPATAKASVLGGMTG